MEVWLFSLLMVLGIFVFLLLSVAYTVYAERKVSALIQNRVGPDRAGPFGLLQPFADLIKLLFKEEIVHDSASKFIFNLAPLISVTASLITFAIIPVAYGYVITDVNIGILYLLSITSVGVYGLTLAGWSSNNKYSLLGAMRSSAQMISYELTMGLAIIAVILITQSLSVVSIVETQTDNPLLWNIVKQPLGFIIFVIASFAETNRLPFDLPESEQELVGGFHTEYSSMRFALFFLAEYANLVVASALMATLYLGGYQVPWGTYWMAGFPEILQTVLQMGFFFLKMCLFIFIFIWVRWTLPRFKYNQLMFLGWRYLLPLALLNVIITAAVLLIFN